MRALLAHLLAVALVALPVHARELDPLESTLWQLRRYVRVIDPAVAARRVEVGGVLMRLGYSATSMAAEVDRSDGDDPDDAVAILAMIGVIVAAAGLVTYLIGAYQQIDWPRPRVQSSADYMQAKRMKDFMKLAYDGQVAVAARDPAFAEFLTKLSAAYALCAQYGLIEEPALVTAAPAG